MIPYPLLFRHPYILLPARVFVILRLLPSRLARYQANRLLGYQAKYRVGRQPSFLLGFPPSSSFPSVLSTSLAPFLRAYVTYLPFLGHRPQLYSTRRYLISLAPFVYQFLLLQYSPLYPSLHLIATGPFSLRYYTSPVYLLASFLPSPSPYAVQGRLQTIYRSCLRIQYTFPLQVYSSRSSLFRIPQYTFYT